MTNPPHGPARAGVEHDDAVERGRRVEPLDRVAGAIGRHRVALGRHDDSDARDVGELEVGERSSPRAAASSSAPASVFEAGQHDLGLRVAEAHVVLDELRAVGREHQPGVQHAAVVDAEPGQVSERRRRRTCP